MARRYAEATCVRIQLAGADGELTFSVTDDGRGFDPNATTYGSDLKGIADRLAAARGGVAVMSEPGSGTTVRGTLPTTAGKGSP